MNEVDDGAAATDRRGRSELRLALALRGGVSLAVWIGGACAEIDRLRRGPDEEAGGLWSSTLGLSGHDRVVVDVMAGASAGGLNGVLYSASQIYDFDFSRIRDIWVEVASAADLRRTAPPWPSLFDGDGYFLEQVRTRLRGLIETAPAPSDRHRLAVDLRLSATTVEPLLRPMPSPSDEQLVERRHASGFHFRQHAEAWMGTDYPARPDSVGRGREPFEDAIGRLALAARATSSFPGAFEAAAVHAGRPRTFADPTPTHASTGALDSSGTFLDRQHRLRSAPGADVIPVADGGILDNIPIARALEAVAEAPADGPTRRALVYLHPGAPTPTTARTDATEEQRRSTLAVARGFVQARVGSETIARDIEAIEEHNRAARESLLLRRSGIGAVKHPEGLVQSARSLRSRDNYVAARTRRDADLIAALLSDPVGLLGRDRFPLTVGAVPIADEVWRSPLGTWTSTEREQLVVDLAEHVGTELLPPVRGFISPRWFLEHGVQPIRRVNLLLLEWALLLEGAGVEGAGERKARLYRALTFQRHVLEEARRLAWVAAFAAIEGRIVDLREAYLANPHTPGRVAAVAEVIDRRAAAERAVIVRIATEHIDRVCSVDEELAGRLERALCDGHDDAGDPRAEARQAVLASIDELATIVLADVDAAVGPCSEVDARLAELVGTTLDRVPERFATSEAGPVDAPRRDLRAVLLDSVLVPTTIELAASVAGTGDDGATPGPGGLIAAATGDVHEAAGPWLLHRALMGPSRSAPPWLTSERREEAVVDLLVSLEIAGFAELATSRGSKRPVEFVRLSAANRTPVAPAFTALNDAAREVGAAWDPDAKDDEPRGIHVDLKLAGNELANFSAFLVDDWRRNDWMWGRLDAVPTLVDLLVRPERLSADFDDPAELFRAIERAISGSHLPWLADQVLDERRRTAILDECRALCVEDTSAATASVAAIRDALIAARQWEILADELDENDQLDENDRAAVLRAVGGHAVGAERLPADEALVEEFTELAAVAKNMVLWNVETSRGRRLPDSIVWLAHLLVPPLADRASARLLLGDAATQGRRRRRLTLTAIVTLVIGFAVGLAVGVGAAAAVAGFAAAVVLALVAGGIGIWRVRRTIGPGRRRRRAAAGPTIDLRDSAVVHSAAAPHQSVATTTLPQ
ncbi:MAG: DUF3376 domain-containing protein [Actinomycetota bacterium]